ncbi:4406_t:CDS:1, partial [Funneliformis geosporum]
ETIISNNAKSVSPTSPIPSIEEFLNSLNQKHNSKVYASFKKPFLDEEITVNVIKDLSDEQLYKL